MQHIIETNNLPVITEKLKFVDVLNNSDVELTCDWSLNAGYVTMIGTPIADQLDSMGFDKSVTDSYRRIYSDANMQSLIVMIFAGVQ